VSQQLDEKDKKLGETLARLRDGLQGLQPAINAIDEFLNYLGKPLGPVNEKPYEKLFWETRQPPDKEPFQMTTQKANQNSDLFRHLQMILKQNKRRYTEKDWSHYYWLGSQGDDVIFRRKKKKA